MLFSFFLVELLVVTVCFVVFTLASASGTRRYLCELIQETLGIFSITWRNFVFGRIIEIKRTFLLVFEEQKKQQRNKNVHTILQGIILSRRASFRLHQPNEVVEVDFPVAVCIRMFDHLVDFCFGQLLSDSLKHVHQFVDTDIALIRRIECSE